MQRERIEKYIATQEKNLLFIKERIKIQNQKSYNPFKMVTMNYGCEFVMSTNTRCGYRKKEPTIVSVEVKERFYNNLDLLKIKENIIKAKKRLEN